MGSFVLVGTWVAAFLAARVALGRAGRAPVASDARAGRAAGQVLAWLDRAGARPPLSWLGGPWREAANALAERLSTAGVASTAEAAIAMLALAAGACALAGAVVSGSLVGVPVALGASVAAAPLWSAARARRRDTELARQVPDVYRSLSRALAAGRTLSQAIAYVGSSGEGPLCREFSRASLMVSCGTPAAEALDELCRRTDAPGVRLMVDALVVSSRTGAPLQGLFARSARLVERRFELERELAAKTAQVRLSARIVSALPAGMVAVLTLVSPDFREGLATPSGALCVAVAAMLDALALALIRRLMRGVI